MSSLSVIMPVYNSERSVRIAIRSTLRSLPPDSELLVLNDASTDNSLEAVRSVHDRRLKVLENSENLGVSASLALLLESVDSRYVARMDADDVCLPWRFHVQKRFLRRNPKIGIVFGGVMRFGHGTIPRITLPVPYGNELSLSMLPLRNPFIHPTMLARTDQLRRSGGYTDGPAEDYDLWLRAANTGIGMSRIGFPVIGYRHHSNQVSSQKEYAERTVSDVNLKNNLCKLAGTVYPQVDKDTMWQLLRHRLQSEDLPHDVSVKSIMAGLSSDIKLSQWESAYLRRRLNASIKGE